MCSGWVAYSLCCPMQAINQYTTSLQKGLRAANLR